MSGHVRGGAVDGADADVAVDGHWGDTAAGVGDFGHGELAGVVNALGLVDRSSGVIFGLRPPRRPRARAAARPAWVMKCWHRHRHRPGQRPGRARPIRGGRGSPQYRAVGPAGRSAREVPPMLVDQPRRGSHAHRRWVPRRSALAQVEQAVRHSTPRPVVAVATVSSGASLPQHSQRAQRGHQDVSVASAGMVARVRRSACSCDVAWRSTVFCVLKTLRSPASLYDLVRVRRPSVDPGRGRQGDRGWPGDAGQVGEAGQGHADAGAAER